MTQRKAILARTLSVAFLIPACLSFAQAMEAPGPDNFVIRAGHQQRVAPTGRSRTSGETRRQTEMRWDSSASRAGDATLNYYHVLIGKGTEALKPMPSSRSKREH